VRILDWADRCLQILNRDIEAFEDENSDPLVGNHDRTTGEYVIRLPQGAVRPIPDDWVFRVGDIVHNMRVALDYLTFAIVKPPSNDVKRIRRTSFPIIAPPRTALDWPGMAGLRLPDLDAAIVGVFESLQAYHRRDGQWTDSLVTLDELENVHKHRYSLSAQLSIPTSSYTGWGAPNFEVVGWGIASGPLEDGAEVYRLRMGTPNTIPNRHFGASVKVCISEARPAATLPVEQVLVGISHHIREFIFPALEKFI
jgi:hypothetical protein